MGSVERKEKARKRLVIRLWDYGSTLYSGVFIHIFGADYRCKLKSARIKGRVSSLVVPEAAAELSQVVK